MIDIKSLAQKVQTEGGKKLQAITAESGKKLQEITAEGSKRIKESAPAVKAEFAAKKEIFMDKMDGVAKNIKKGAANLKEDMTSNFGDFEKKPKQGKDEDTEFIDNIIDELKEDAEKRTE